EGTGGFRGFQGLASTDRNSVTARTVYFEGQKREQPVVYNLCLLPLFAFSPQIRKASAKVNLHDQKLHSYIHQAPIHIANHIAMPESTTSDATLVPPEITLKEELKVLHLRGKKNWDSRFNEANPAQATIDESEPQGPVSFGAIAQIMSRGHKDPIKAEDIQAAYNQCLKDNRCEYDEVVSRKKKAAGIGQAVVYEPSGTRRWVACKHRAISDIHKQKPKGQW
ncbi:MAG: hypothetical protein Q9180_009799, partial [Flavoplaca navasiana]